MRRIGVLTSGGDSPGMNAAIMSVAKAARHYGMSLIGIKRGYNGTLCKSNHIEDDMVELDLDTILDIADQPGTYLRTARCLDFLRPEMRAHAVSNIHEMGIEGIVVIGGDGSYHGALELCELGVPCVGIPGTIDNDLAYTEMTLGYDTALNSCVEDVRAIRATSRSHDRPGVVEVMGRHAGYLALYVGISVGATAVLIPERETDFDRDIVEKIRRARLSGTTHYMVVVAEGAGSAVDIGKRIHEELGIDPRVTVLGHIQRGGSPSARDRETASRMGYEAVQSLAEGRGNRIICTQDGKVVDLDMEEALAMTKVFDMERYRVLEATTTGAGD